MAKEGEQAGNGAGTAAAGDGGAAGGTGLLGAEAAKQAAANEGGAEGGDGSGGGGEESSASPWYAAPERPDWLPEQFWDPKKPEGERFNADALAKSWKDLRTAAKTKAPEVPESPDAYEVLLDDKGTKAPADDLGWKAAREAAHTAGLSKAQFETLAKEFITRAREIQGDGAPVVDLEAEKAQLGPKADQIITTVATWGRNLVELGVWSPDDFEEIVEMGSTARGIAALNKLRTHYTREQLIPTRAVDDGGLPSKDELYAAVGSKEYQSDPAYRAKIDRQFRQVFGDEPAARSEPSIGMR